MAVDRGCNTVAVNEPNLSGEEKEILRSMGFSVFRGRWEKICLSGIVPYHDVLSMEIVVERLEVQRIIEGMENADETKTILKVELERKLWPLKIADIYLPVYIIPIRPSWAGQLFDFHLANASLFGATEALAWSRENVYYRSVSPVSEKAPGRILWYVSSEEKAMGRCRGIVATSYLDEVSVDRAKEIFRRYRRFGVYQWNDIYKLARGAILSDIKALRFSDTEVFRKVVPLQRINEILLENGRPKNTFASPVEVSINIFNKIYEIGKNE